MDGATFSEVASSDEVAEDAVPPATATSVLNAPSAQGAGDGQVIDAEDGPASAADQQTVAEILLMAHNSPGFLPQAEAVASKSSQVDRRNRLDSLVSCATELSDFYLDEESEDGDDDDGAIEFTTGSEDAVEEHASSPDESMEQPSPATSAPRRHTHASRKLSAAAEEFLRKRRDEWAEQATSSAASADAAAPALSLEQALLCNRNGRIGIYTATERSYIIERYLAKKSRRQWQKKIRYGCRKNLADRRVRVKGRFVKADVAAGIASNELRVAGSYVPLHPHATKVPGSGDKPGSSARSSSSASVSTAAASSDASAYSGSAGSDAASRRMRSISMASALSGRSALASSPGGESGRKRRRASMASLS